MSVARHTPLYEVHKRLGARIIEFGGWEMPVQYSGVLDEHRTVRSAAGLFDISHMGEVEVIGADALAIVQSLITNDASKLATGQAQYSVICYPHGGIVDDLTVYKLGEDHFFLVINAATTEKDVQWIRENAHGDAEIRNISDDVALIAIQGRKAEEILQKLTYTPLSSIRYFWFARGKVKGVDAMISRTGYTGEDGFELYFPSSAAEEIWTALFEAGKGEGIKPIGLGARDTLRLEMVYALYGHDIDETTTPLEADLGWVVKFQKGDFIGKEALRKQRKEGIKRKFVAFEMVDPGIPRQHYGIFVGEAAVGEVTSGTMSPSLNKAIGVGYVAIEHATIGEELEIDIRGQRRKAKIVPRPFYPSQVKKLQEKD
ncbi:MAG: glycine cleavage system aminomethyltransferase GcvT [Candidatus Tectomicrobia bacterium]|nr:glycine cleavage system aminomethyltransferase GcvT [Candidatus Tectomicrobia bacterium]